MDLPTDGKALSIGFDSAELAEVMSPRTDGARVLIDPAGAVVFVIEGRGIALRLTSQEDAAKLTLACLALSSRIAERDALTAAAASDALDRIRQAAAGNA